MDNAEKKVILVAVVGTSPAVLTETVWALAHLENPVVPDEVVAITTLGGQAAIRSCLFGEEDGWGRLVRALEDEGIPTEGRLRFGETQQSIVLLSDKLRKRHLPDIANADDNAAMADIFLQVLRGYADNDPSTEIYASIAGGRKTMGALMLSCMSLVARAWDHVLHVLVNPPFDGGVEPVFLFPEKRRRYRPRDGSRTLSAKDAAITLIDIPFVKMRGWYQDKFKTLPTGYSDLVRAAQSSGPAASAKRPLLRFDFEEGRLFADDSPVRLSPVEFMVLAVELLLRPDDLGKTLVDIGGRAGADMGWVGDFATEDAYGNRKFKSLSGSGDDLRHARSSLRAKLERESSLRPFVRELVPRWPRRGTWPETRMSADIGLLRRRTGL